MHGLDTGALTRWQESYYESKVETLTREPSSNDNKQEGSSQQPCVCRFPCYIMNNNTDFVVTRHDVALIEVFIADNWITVAVAVCNNNLPLLL